MSTFKIVDPKQLPPPPTRIAVGKKTGSLFLMTGKYKGYVICGAGVYAGREGYYFNERYDEEYEPLPVGAVIEITA